MKNKRNNVIKLFGNLPKLFDYKPSEKSLSNYNKIF